jgi:hypothetical protein
MEDQFLSVAARHGAFLRLRRCPGPLIGNVCLSMWGCGPASGKGWLPLRQSVWVASVAGFDDPAFYGDRWAGVYDEHHAEFGPAPAVEFLARLAGDRRVLELAIGTGRVAIPLAGLGIAVEGIDASAAMVERLRAKPGGASLPVVIGDMAQRTGPDGPASRAAAPRTLQRLGPAAIRFQQRRPCLGIRVGLTPPARPPAKSISRPPARSRRHRAWARGRWHQLPGWPSLRSRSGGMGSKDRAQELMQ